MAALESEKYIEPIIIIIGTHGKIMNEKIPHDILPEFDADEDIIKINATRPGICNFLNDDTEWLHNIVSNISQRPSLLDTAQHLKQELEKAAPERKAKHSTRGTFKKTQDDEDREEWLEYQATIPYTISSLKSGFINKRYSLEKGDTQSKNLKNYHNKITVLSSKLPQEWSLYDVFGLQVFKPTTGNIIADLYERWWKPTYPDLKFNCIIIDLSCNAWEKDVTEKNKKKFSKTAYGLKKRRRRRKSKKRRKSKRK